MDLSLAQLEFCRSLAGEALLAAPLPEDPLAALTQLRRICDRDEAAAVMAVRDVRRRAAASGKFPPALADRLLGSDTMLQQSSSLRMSVYVGRRLAALAGEGAAVWDLCCGLGADAIGLAMADATVAGYDRAAEAVACAEHNAQAAGVADRCAFAVADVMELAVDPDAIVHIDPDRRPTGRRTASLADCSPDENFLRRLTAETRAGAMKLSPALPPAMLAGWPRLRVEHVSEDGTCKQLLGWWGETEPAPPTATVVWGPADDPRSLSLPAGRAEQPKIAEPGTYLVEPDPAVIAAGATADLAAHLTERSAPAWRIAAGVDWLSAEEKIDTPLARWFRLLRAVPGRRRDVARALRELDAGIVEIKPRGLKLDTDALQRRLRGRGSRNLAVLWCKTGASQRAFIAERV